MLGNLERIGGFSPELLEKIADPIVGMEIPFHYRNKAQFPFGKDEKPIFTIYPSAGNRDLIPQKRSYTVEMTGFENSGETVVVRKNGVGTDAQISYDRWKKAIVVEIPETETDAMIEVSLEHTASGARNDVVERCFDFLNQAEIEFVQKDRLYERSSGFRPITGRKPFCF